MLLFKNLILKGSVGSFVLLVVNSGLMFGIGVILARYLGANEYGSFIYTMAWINILSLPAVFGFNEMLVRQIPVYLVNREFALLRGLLHHSYFTVLLVSTIFSIVFAMAIQFGVFDQTTQTKRTLYIAIALLPAWSIAILNEGVMRGLGEIVKSQFPLLIVRGILFLTATQILFQYLNTSFNASSAIYANDIAILLSMLLGLVLIRIILKEYHKENIGTTYDIRLWLAMAFPFLLISIMRVITKQIDIVLLGLLLDTKSAGIFSVVRRGAEITFMPIIAINASLGPVLARYSAIGNISQLKSQVHKSARLMLMTSLPIGLVMFLFPGLFLSIYGPEFVVGVPALRIMVVGTLSSIILGPVIIILMMTGNSKSATIGTAIGGMLGILLNLLMIPKYGLIGAALATSLSLFVMNIVMFIQVYKKLNIISFGLNIKN
jgi:O-antigen/teichoic acid export membrane protein